jgi:hypothetical protein
LSPYGDCSRLQNLHLDYLADARHSEVAPALRTDHDRVVSTSLFVDSSLSFDPGSLDDQRTVGIGASLIGHIISLLAPCSTDGSFANWARLWSMAFGQQSGPPASTKQMNELMTLLNAAGHTDFRDARGPMGFTQRQAGGKFSRDEATAFIDQLQEQDSSGDDAETPPFRREQPSGDPLLRRISDASLAEELKRRGWTVVEP